MSPVQEGRCLKVCLNWMVSPLSVIHEASIDKGNNIGLAPTRSRRSDLNIPRTCQSSHDYINQELMHLTYPMRCVDRLLGLVLDVAPPAWLLRQSAYPVHGYVVPSFKEQRMETNTCFVRPLIILEGGVDSSDSSTESDHSCLAYRFPTCRGCGTLNQERTRHSAVCLGLGRCLCMWLRFAAQSRACFCVSVLTLVRQLHLCVTRCTAVMHAAALQQLNVRWVISDMY